MMSQRKHYYLIYGLIVLGLVSVIVTLAVSSSDIRKTLTQEDGPIEILSAAGYFICLIMLFFLKAEDFKSRLSMMFVILILGLRELDFHVLFTPMSLEKLKFYWSPDISIHAKIIGASIILVLLLCLLCLIKKHLLDFLKSIKTMDPGAIGVFLGIGLICVAKTLDGFQRKLADFDFTITNDIMELATVMEETLELGIPLMFVVAIIAHFQDPRILRV